MRTRRLLLVGLAYLVFDLADPILPGAFSFEVRDSEIDDAACVQPRSQHEVALAVLTPQPEGRVEPRDDAFARQRPAVTQPSPRDVPPPRRPVPHEARHAPAPSLDDH
jgi:hypothetical protein